MVYRRYEFRERIVILTELFELKFQSLSRVWIQKKDGNLATLDTIEWMRIDGMTWCGCPSAIVGEESIDQQNSPIWTVVSG